MSQDQINFIAGTFLILIVVTLAAQFRWLPQRSFITAPVYSIAGVAMMVCLRIANIPPDWFSGSKSAFALAAMLTVSAFIGGAGAEFRVPFFLGIGGTLLILNIAAHL